MPALFFLWWYAASRDDTHYSSEPPPWLGWVGVGVLVVFFLFLGYIVFGVAR